MGLDPKSINAIRLVKDRTSGSSHTLAGPITPKYITLAIPQVGKHRGWIDHVVERVLCEIIAAYRVNGTKATPFWSGPAYRIDRHDFSIRLLCRPRDISRAVVFLEKQGFLTVYRQTRYKHGEPCGTMVFAIPNVEAIDRKLAAVQAVVTDYLAEQKAAEDGAEGVGSEKSKVPDIDTPPPQVRHSGQSTLDARSCQQAPQSLNVPQCTPQAAEGHAARRVEQTSASPPTHSPGRVAEGGEAAAPGSTSPGETNADQRNGHLASGPASDAQQPDPAPIERKVQRFCYYWTEAGQRTGYIEVLAVEKHERDALREFFMKNQRNTAWFAAVAILAWRAADEVKKKRGFDPAWACRRSTDIQSFLSRVSKILSELGANGYEVNAYRLLRCIFTDSELSKQGFNTKLSLEVLDPEDCWENAPEAPAYYRDNGLEMPPEVRAACAGPTGGQSE